HLLPRRAVTGLLQNNTPVEIAMTDSQKWPWLSGVFALGWLLYLLSPVLTPFLIAVLLAYLGDPIVDRLEALRCSRTTAIITVFAVMMFAFLSLALVFADFRRSNQHLFQGTWNRSSQQHAKCYLK